jgi:hypothetical protein
MALSVGWNADIGCGAKTLGWASVWECHQGAGDVY